MTTTHAASAASCLGVSLELSCTARSTTSGMWRGGVVPVLLLLLLFPPVVVPPLLLLFPPGGVPLAVLRSIAWSMAGLRIAGYVGT